VGRRALVVEMLVVSVMFVVVAVVVVAVVESDVACGFFISPPFSSRDVELCYDMLQLSFSFF
jgi:hypothetical protein